MKELKRSAIMIIDLIKITAISILVMTVILQVKKSIVIAYTTYNIDHKPTT